MNNIAFQNMMESHLIYEIKPEGCRFWSGIAERYNEEYPVDSLNGIIDEVLFKDIIHGINNILMAYWPCPF